MTKAFLKITFSIIYF